MSPSKKQIRVSGLNNVRTKLPGFTRKMINIVLNDNTVFFGELKEITKEEVILTNMRRKQIRLPIEKITEFFSDINA